MKKTMKLSVLLAGLLACGVSGVALMQNAEAQAEETYAFEMVEGASLKLNETGGIRFRVKMDQYWYDYLTENEQYQLRGMITTKKAYDAANGDITAVSNQVGGEMDESLIYEADDGYFYANLCLTEVESKTGYAVGVAYIYDVTNEKVEKTASINAELTRGSLYDLTNSATLSATTDYVEVLQSLDVYNSWYGTQEYPIVIRTNAQYTAFLAKIAAGKQFADKYVKVYSEALAGTELDASMPENTTVATVSTVTFYDADKTTVLDSKSFEGEKDVTPPANPTKADDDLYTYVFKEWTLSDGTAANLNAVSESMDVYAKYDRYALRGKVSTIETFDGDGLITSDRMLLGNTSVYAGANVSIALENQQLKMTATANNQFMVLKYADLKAGETYVMDFDMTYTSTAANPYTFWINENTNAGDIGTNYRRIETVYRPTQAAAVAAGSTTPANIVNGENHYTFLFTPATAGNIYFTVRCNDTAGSVAYFDNVVCLKQSDYSASLKGVGIATHGVTYQTKLMSDGKMALAATGTEATKFIYFNLGSMTAGKTYTITFKANMYSSGTLNKNAFAFGVGATYNFSSTNGIGGSKFVTKNQGENTLTVTPTTDAATVYLSVRTQAAGVQLEIWDIQVTEANAS